jgi:hypothetical protein
VAVGFLILMDKGEIGWQSVASFVRLEIIYLPFLFLISKELSFLPSILCLEILPNALEHVPEESIKCISILKFVKV